MISVLFDIVLSVLFGLMLLWLAKLTREYFDLVFRD